MRQLINNTFDRGNFGNNRQIRTLVGRVVADGWACAYCLFVARFIGIALSGDVEKSLGKAHRHGDASCRPDVPATRASRRGACHAGY